MHLLTIAVNDIEPVLAPKNKSQQTSLVTVGQRQPIRLMPLKEGKYAYRVVDGRRRFTDLQQTGATEVLALVDEVSEQGLHLDALTLNSGTTNFMDEALHIQQLKNNWNMSDADIAKVSNCSPSKINSLTQLLKLIQPLREMMLRGDLKQGGGLSLSKLPKEKQEEIAEGKTKLTNKECAEFLTKYKGEEVGGQIEYPQLGIPVFPGVFIEGDIVRSMVEDFQTHTFTWQGGTYTLKVIG